MFLGFLEEKPADTTYLPLHQNHHGGKDGRDFNREDQHGRQLRDRNTTDNQGAHKKRVPDAEQCPSVNGLKLKIPKNT